MTIYIHIYIYIYTLVFIKDYSTSNRVTTFRTHRPHFIITLINPAFDAILFEPGSESLGKSRQIRRALALRQKKSTSSITQFHNSTYQLGLLSALQ